MSSTSAPARTPDELLTFAGLARRLIQADGEFTAEEQFVVEKVLAELQAPRAPGGGPYRDEAPPAQPDPEATWELIDRAGRELGDKEALVRAAEKITDPEAREAIYCALREIAEADVITNAEWPLLEWLERLWEIKPA